MGTWKVAGVQTPGLAGNRRLWLWHWPTFLRETFFPVLQSYRNLLQLWILWIHLYAVGALLSTEFFVFLREGLKFFCAVAWFGLICSFVLSSPKDIFSQKHLFFFYWCLPVSPCVMNFCVICLRFRPVLDAYMPVFWFLVFKHLSFAVIYIYLYRVMALSMHRQSGWCFPLT